MADSIWHRGNMLDLIRLFLLQEEAISREEALMREVVIFDSREGQREFVVPEALIHLPTHSYIHTYIHTYIN